jgi:hypothetical protein
MPDTQVVSWIKRPSFWNRIALGIGLIGYGLLTLEGKIEDDKEKSMGINLGSMEKIELSQIGEIDNPMLKQFR